MIFWQLFWVVKLNEKSNSPPKNPPNIIFIFKYMNYIEDFNSFSLLNTQSPIRSTQKTKLIESECNINIYII